MRRAKDKKRDTNQEYTDQDVTLLNVDRNKNHRIDLKRQIKNFILITLGIFSAAFGFKGFLLTNHFIDGGATGISLLISALTKIPLYILIICVNIPFIILAHQVMGRLFAIKTAMAIAGLALVLAFVRPPTEANDTVGRV